jgi:hypothetical protein
MWCSIISQMCDVMTVLCETQVPVCSECCPGPARAGYNITKQYHIYGGTGILQVSSRYPYSSLVPGYPWYLWYYPRVMGNPCLKTRWVRVTVLKNSTGTRTRGFNPFRTLQVCCSLDDCKCRQMSPHLHPSVLTWLSTNWRKLFLS